ncbi:MAG: hypothetical protein ACD_9C00308G0002 [uncultured bacterium]|nr:MAG: hypothetical protein ACD_9C00308G0002 [uncultured bacterium]
MTQQEAEKVIHKELSYKIVGTLFEVYNELGYGYKEKYYEKALMVALGEQKIKFKTQVPFALKFKEEIIGRNYLDFLIEDKIVLEIKKGKHFSRNNLDQVKQYLKITNLKLAILANFTPDGIKYIRVLNA